MNIALNPGSIFPQSLRPLLRPCADEEQGCVCLASTMTFSAYVAKFSLGESHPRQCEIFGLRPSGLQVGGNVGVLDWGCREDGVTLYIHIFFNSFPIREACAGLLCHAADRFLLDSFKVEIETLSEFFPRSY